ncbi:MAG: hypothetical protein SPE43_05950 [Ruminococcus sp.]|nr:hypothetical protein [Oscillospiraceae bacterium]MDY4413893.1 hypothetical protein [Ruminococcus sp.]
MAYYDNRQFNNMRNDAIRRTREMYRNSMVNTSHYSTAENYKNEKPVQEVEEIPPEPEMHINSSNISYKNNYNKPSIPENIGKILGGSLDSEKLTIIALIIILAKEGADIKLILALGYILI